MATIDTRMTTAALSKAQGQVLNVCALGSDVILIKAGTKDELGTITSETTLTLKSFPTRFTPFDRDVKEKISWAEEVEIICYVAKKELDNASLSLDRIKKQYKKMRFKNRTYDIKYIDYYSAFGNDFLYVTFGGKS